MTACAGPRPSDKWIPWYIVLFFVVISGVLATFVTVALKTHTGTVTDGAYQKGLDYNITIEKARRQEALGWRAALAQEEGRVVFTLKDTEGAPVEISAAAVWFFRPTDAKADIRGTMACAGAGRCVHGAAQAPRGLWEVRVRAETAQGPYLYAKRMVFE